MTDSNTAQDPGPPAVVPPGERHRLDVALGAAVLAIALAIRLQGLFHDLPFSYYGDELHFVKRAMSLGAGDLNPHWFHKPAFLMYILLFCFGLQYGVGMLTGRFDSAEAFGASFLADQGPFILTGRLVVFAFGLATVWVVWRLGKRVGGTAGGVAAGLAAAVLAPMVQGSQVVKADVPSGFFVAASVLAYLGARDSERWKPVILAGVLAGASLGTKYYGIIVLPAFAVAELVGIYSRGRSVTKAAGRYALLLAVCLGTFFVTSPYNFLDPTWGQSVWSRVAPFVKDVEESEAYDADSGKSFTPGAEAVSGAAEHFFVKLVDVEALGWGLTVLGLLGTIGLLTSREKRWYAIVLALPPITFFVVAVTMVPYHLNPRQLNAVYPLVCVLAWPGAALVGRILRMPPRIATGIGALLVLAAVTPSLLHALKVNEWQMRVDSRNLAYEWISENVSRDKRILLDDYGPILIPNPEAVMRMQRRLKELPGGEAFTHAEETRLRLLRKYPQGNAFDLEKLGHQWWVNREQTDEELTGNWRNRDASNPLIDRIPDTLEEYRDRGVHYVITNSDAWKRYYEDHNARAFPTFRRFYDELLAREPLRSFDPSEWGGKGPVVRIYDLGS
jgi:hypothetical protein